MIMLVSVVMIHHLFVVASPDEERPVIVYLERFGMLAYNGRLYELLGSEGFQKLHYHMNADACCLNHQYEMMPVTKNCQTSFPLAIRNVWSVCLQQRLDAQKNPFADTNPYPPPYALTYATLGNLFPNRVYVITAMPALRRLQRWHC